MKKLTTKSLIFLLSFLFILSCNPAQLRRHGDAAGEVSSTTTTNALTETDNTVTNSGISDGSGFESCQQARVQTATELGNIKACQNRHDSTQIRFQVAQPTQNSKLCLIPTYTNPSTGQSIPLRLQAACLSPQEGQAYTSTLSTNETDSANFNCFNCRANSVIFLDQTIVTAYYQCAQANINFLKTPQNCCAHALGQGLPSYCHQGNTPSVSLCKQRASQYALSKCIPFRDSYKNKKYLMYRF